MRGEYLKALKDMGVKVEKHHHEVAPSQHELGIFWNADKLLIMFNSINMQFKW